jgi:hypothetical protein
VRTGYLDERVAAYRLLDPDAIDLDVLVICCEEPGCAQTVADLPAEEGLDSGSCTCAEPALLITRRRLEVA